MSSIARPALVVCATCAIWGCSSSAATSSYALRGVWHAVRPGDTLNSIASAHGALPEEVAELNDLAGNGDLAERREIFVPQERGKKPGGQKPAPSARHREAKNKPAPDQQEQSPSPRKKTCKQMKNPCLAWPVQGELVRPFGTRSSNHDGIDIAAEKGAAVRAADDGEVIYAGNEIKGYGNLIILRHPGSLITVYAHNEQNLVKEGEAVKRGQTLAKVGQTGTATMPHLHFEVRAAEKPTDPLSYLP